MSAETDWPESTVTPPTSPRRVAAASRPALGLPGTRRFGRTRCVGREARRADHPRVAMLTTPIVASITMIPAQTTPMLMARNERSQPIARSQLNTVAV